MKNNFSKSTLPRSVQFWENIRINDPKQCTKSHAKEITIKNKYRKQNKL